MFVIAIHIYYPFLYILKWYLKNMGLYTSAKTITLYTMAKGQEIKKNCTYCTGRNFYVLTMYVEFLSVSKCQVSFFLQKNNPPHLSLLNYTPPSITPYTMNVTLSMVSMPNIILITPFPIVFFYCSN